MSRRVERDDPAFLGAVVAYAQHNVQPWHTPGHKQGRGASKWLRQAMGPALQCDLSDVLHDPASNHSWDQVLREAENKAAALFGAAWTRFLVNGTSGGVHAMLVATLAEGDVVIVPRQAHLCVAGGLVLSGATPRYIPLQMDKVAQIPLPVGPKQYADALQRAPKARAVVVTYPNYYGLCCDLQGVVAIAKAYGAWVLVDEAHGAHYAFHRRFPRPALACGAHIVAQSTHKTLGALTQASMLHAASDANTEALERALGLLQTTSPSSLLLASLDSARAQMEVEGEGLWAQVIEVAEELRQALGALPGVRCLGADDLGDIAYDWDPTRIIVGVEGVGGLELAAALRLKYGIQVEMADTRYCVALVGLGDHIIHGRRLVAAIDALRQTLPRSPRQVLALPSLPPMALSPRQAVQAPSERLSWGAAVGRIAGQTLCPYPPGVPVLVPGEVVTEEVVEYLHRADELGFYIRGDAGDGAATVVA